VLWFSVGSSKFEDETIRPNRHGPRCLRKGMTAIPVPVSGGRDADSFRSTGGALLVFAEVSKVMSRIHRPSSAGGRWSDGSLIGVAQEAMTLSDRNAPMEYHHNRHRESPSS